MKNKRHLSWPIFAFSVMLFGCATQDQKQEQNKALQQTMSEDYAWKQPETFIMPEKLIEISGIAFHEGNPETLFAIQDEDGEVFKLNWNDDKTLQTIFEKQGDFEDISILNNQVYILKSDGTIYQFPYADLEHERTHQTKRTKVLPKGEYEGLFGDPQSGLLYALCKECEKDQDHVSGYILSTTGDLILKDRFQLNVDDIQEKAGKFKKRFRPSALAKNPITEEWYILSSVNKLLVIADANWQILRTSKLDAALHGQPEGIAFDAQGNLYISNEGKDKRPANILRFKRK
jgi:uncharacterized protein YjiK